MGELLMKRIIFTVLLISIVISGCYSDELNIDKNMVFVEGGEFLIGKEGKTSHLVKVKLNNYYISKYETTVEQWEQFLKETGTPYQWKDEYTDVREESPYSDSPISVHWKQAIMYANWVSRIYGLEECYIIHGRDVEWRRDADGYRLLTDAEWEFAARGGTLSKGYEYSGSNDLDEVAWTGWNAEGISQPVGTKKANEIGIYDMSGNENEWCWDLSLRYPYDSSIFLVNPEGPSTEEYLQVEKRQYRIARGGSAASFELLFFTTYDRDGGLYEFGEGAGGQGIRLARNAE